MDFKMKTLLFYLFIINTIGRICGEDTAKVKRCLGTNSAYSISEDRMEHLKKMVLRYENCTIVHGNLEITGLEKPDTDVSFLKDIEVVTGYVLIAINYVPYLPLEKLKIIRGQELYGDNKYALIIAVNYNRDNPVQGLRQLGFKSLTEIQRGNVSIIQNNRMCYDETVNWADIINPTERRKNWSVNINNTVVPGITTCGKCHESCKSGFCWGEGPDMCQNLTSVICHENCGDARCRGPLPDDCCDSECACGCSGSTDRDCIACLHVNNSGVCQLNCPPQYIYDQQTSRNVPNPDFKYHFNDLCVDKCPDNMLVEENGCVKHCRKGRHNNGSGVCVSCTGNTCNKECFGVGDPDGPLNASATVDSRNVHFFEGCNIVRGNVIFQAYAFTGDSHTHTPPMTADQIVKAFSGVKVINGFLKILSWPAELEDFSVFSNLTTIIGIDLFRDVVSLLIQDSITNTGPFHLSHVKSLGFHSLKTINYGNVYIGYMKNLCYQDRVNWTEIVRNPVSHHNFNNGILLRANLATCDNKTCNRACSDNGCWGPGANECLACKSISYQGNCKTKCEKNLGLYRQGNECKGCHPECNGTCDGPGPALCTTCRHLRDIDRCVVNCPMDKYADLPTMQCEPCHANCYHPDGNTLCSGPNSTLGPGGCEFCHTVVTDRDLQAKECLPRNHACPNAHFLSKGGLVAAIQACVPCIEGCTNCTGPTDKDCRHKLPFKPDKAVIIAVVITIVALGLIALSCFILHHRREKSKKKRQMSMRALGLEGAPEPMTPSGVAPNQAQLRIVKETELRIGKILGSGAFGTVHKGYWIPDLAPREKVKVPVAIKVLRDESSQVASNEILDEAFVMASCEHTNLVRILGISLSQRIMLITQLMPLGNLLEYVRDNKENIGSQNLLNWSLQIAKGMCYLAEEKHLVHRDLAARNVLVKSPNHVRITDFGLAKLLDVNEDVYRAEGGKMPIKWLALESIQHRLFTQKSDVWSFGVTLWELMTFGKKPYENVPAREVHTLLERGERLLQPTTCTIDVYMLMIKCWTVDPDSRPTFRELVEDFSKMARDPQRYLVIPNDGRLPQLPSPTTSEFFRTLKYEEGDDFPLQDAEEYFHPGFDDFDRPNPNGHFPLQPAPVRAQWRKQPQDSRQNLLMGRFGESMSSHADSRLDSALTVMTGLPSESGTYPNGCSTPFGLMTPGGNFTPNQTRGHNGFPPFGRSSNRGLHDQMPGTSGLQASNIGPRTQSDSSDVFLNTPNFSRKDGGPWEMANDIECGAQHPGIIRAREDSATMRYSADPHLVFRQESRPNEKDKRGKSTTLVGGFQHDEDGYLAPTDAAKHKPDYLDPMAITTTTYSSNHPGDGFFSASQTNESVSGMENPEYEPTFTPGGRSKNSFTPGMHNLLGARSSLPITDDDGYEIPLGFKPTAEYENVNTSNGLTECPEDENGYLTTNHRTNPRRRGSQSGDSTSSEKRDSGMQSEGDEEAPLKAKNGKAAGGDATDPISGSGARNWGQEPSGSANIKKIDLLQEENNNTSVDNPNYELLENMTDGGFKPMSEFGPQKEISGFHNSNNNFPEKFTDYGDQNVFQRGKNSSIGSNGRKNPLKLTINCDGSGADDLDDNIFITPESRRRNPANGKFASGVGDDDDFFVTPESRRRNPASGKLTPEVDELTGKQGSRTYSEPDSGVGIEMAVDNLLYHRLGSSGWDGSD